MTGVLAEVTQMIQFYPNLAIQYHPEEFVADKILAKAVVSTYAGSYTKFSADTAFQVWDDTMSTEGRANEITWNTSQDSYLAQAYSNTSHIDYDLVARNPVATNWPALKVNVLARNLKLQKELRTIAMFKAGTGYSTTVNTGQGFCGYNWNNASATPIKDVQVLRSLLAMPPNVIVMDRGTFIILQNHPNVLGQRPVNRAGSIDPAELASIFDVKEVVISELKHNTSGNRGRAQTLGYTWAGTFFMGYREPDDIMSTDSMTYASQFLVDNAEIEGPHVSQLMASQEGWVVRAWEDPNRGVAGSMILNAAHKYALKLVAPDLGAYLNVLS